MQKKLIYTTYFAFALTLLFFQKIKADEQFDQGKQIFLGQGNCAACHILKDAKSNGHIGPNLNEIRPDIMRVIYVVKNGIGVMPAFEGQLLNEEIQAVSYYVSVSAYND